MALLCIPGLGSKIRLSNLSSVFVWMLMGDAICKTAQWLSENLDSMSERQSHQVSYCVSVWLGYSEGVELGKPMVFLLMSSMLARLLAVMLCKKAWITACTLNSQDSPLQKPFDTSIHFGCSKDAARVHTAPEDSLRKS